MSEINKPDPCPFCGGESILGDMNNGRWCISCVPCAVRMIDDRKDKVLHEWNKRATPSAKSK